MSLKKVLRRLLATDQRAASFVQKTDSRPDRPISKLQLLIFERHAIVNTVNREGQRSFIHIQEDP